MVDSPTFEEASVKLNIDQFSTQPSSATKILGAYLFSVVDLPDEGLPTRAIKGSRGILLRALGCCSLLRTAVSTDE